MYVLIFWPCILAVLAYSTTLIAVGIARLRRQLRGRHACMRTLCCIVLLVLRARARTYMVSNMTWHRVCLALVRRAYCSGHGMPPRPFVFKVLARTGCVRVP